MKPLRWLAACCVLVAMGCVAGRADPGPPSATGTPTASLPPSAGHASPSGDAPTDRGPSPSRFGSSERLTAHPLGSVAGAGMGYLEYLPSGYGEGSPRPLLVFLHGNGQGGAGDDEGLAKLTETGIPELIAEGDWSSELPFVVLMPQHEERQFSPCMEAPEIDGFLDFALDHYAVDATRVYLTGASCGAIGLWMYLALYRDEVVSAAVPIAGDGRLAVAIAGCELARVPIWAFHGAADEAVPAEGSQQPIRALEGCTQPLPREVKLTLIEGEPHVMWQPIYNGSAGHDIYAWLLSHQREAP